MKTASKKLSVFLLMIWGLIIIAAGECYCAINIKLQGRLLFLGCASFSKVSRSQSSKVRVKRKRH
jgi:hypothetical protein